MDDKSKQKSNQLYLNLQETSSLNIFYYAKDFKTIMMQTDQMNVPIGIIESKHDIPTEPTFRRDPSFEEDVECPHTDFEIHTMQVRCGDEAETIYKICKACQKFI